MVPENCSLASKFSTAPEHFDDVGEQANQQDKNLIAWDAYETPLQTAKVAPVAWLGLDSAHSSYQNRQERDRSVLTV